ncbi:hypothetical protein H0H93_000703 [Arthromyces matolae]|nr:hypothetical protein H0H93_000703 [Arthromyces matolae]
MSSSTESVCFVKPEDDLDSVLRTNLECFDDGFEDLVCRRRRWWDSPRLREWLLERNYRLYENRNYALGVPSSMVNPSNFIEQSSEFPFAYHNPPTRAASQPRFSAYTGERGNVGYAQDASGRHVSIKTVLRDSKEKEVLEYLLQECSPKSIDEFRNVLPVLDILAFEGHWLAITPRWGDQPLEPRFGNMKEGLSFLHENRISHGDIRYENTLVNHTSTSIEDCYNHSRGLLRAEGKLVYALFDFSHAHIFPRNIPIEACRLPSEFAFAVWPALRPHDCHQGELDFDPFAFDVAVLASHPPCPHVSSLA